MKKILVIGASGQVGSELVEALAVKFGPAQVIASDIGVPKPSAGIKSVQLDVLDNNSLEQIIDSEKVTEIYHLAALLSATGEKYPEKAWELNVDGLLNVLNAARKFKIEKIFWPSTIAVFGPHTPKENTPQYCVMDPNTVYGFSKQAGERWCEYYFEKFGVDVRSIRYPGLIGWKAAPGGGTTDYAVHIFYDALKNAHYTSFLNEGTTLPMMYMEDAIRATIDLMEAPAKQISIRSSYNLAGCSFAPEEISQEIKKHIPDFTIDYAPDFRQAIADSWPKSIDDSFAQKDWGWKPTFTLEKMVADMLENIKTLVS